MSINDKFNLITTCPRFREFFTIRELESLLYILEVEYEKIWRSGIGGVILSRVKHDPHDLVRKLRELLHDRPWEFRNIRRVIPVDVVVMTSYEDISKAAWELAKNIPKDASFKIMVKKRYTSISSRKLIEIIADKIDRKVSLENPQYIINIEILGDRTGIALIRPDEILSVEKELLQ